MAIVNKVDKKIKTNIEQVVKYQLLTHCFFNNILITAADLNCLAELVFNPNMELAKFCEHIAEKKIFKSTQSARNTITKLARKNLITKNGKSKKTVELHPSVIVQHDGLVLLDFKVLSNES